MLDDDERPGRRSHDGSGSAPSRCATTSATRRLLAKMVATLDLLSDGRVDVGLGAGWYEPEYRAAGIDVRSSPGTESSASARRSRSSSDFWRARSSTFKGEHYTIDGAICRPLAPRMPRPPVWIGGKGDLLLTTAARVADGWNFSWLGSVDTYGERPKAADEACARRRPRSQPRSRRSVGAYVLDRQ